MAVQMKEQWIPYNYFYAADIPGDIHVLGFDCPAEVQQILDACSGSRSEVDFTVNEDLEDDLER